MSQLRKRKDGRVPRIHMARHPIARARTTQILGPGFVSLLSGDRLDGSRKDPNEGDGKSPSDDISTMLAAGA
jgi:hypothetical protein